MDYAPKRMPTITTLDELRDFTTDELDMVSQAMASPSNSLWLNPVARPPDKPRDGMIVYADGVNFKPAPEGRGSYEYVNGVWRKLGNGVTGYVTPEDFEAVGDGVANDSAACQAALDFAVNGYKAGNVHFPRTYYVPDGLIIHNGVQYSHLSGAGKTSETFKSDTDTPILTIDGTAFSLFLTISDMGFHNSGSLASPRTSTAIHITETGTAGSLSYSTFEDLRFEGFVKGIRVTMPSGLGSADWNLFHSMTFLNIVRGFSVETTIGTGNVLSDMNMVLAGAGVNAGVSTAGIHWGSSTDITGDISIANVQMGGSGTGIWLDGGSYGERIAIMGYQADAGTDPAFDLRRVHKINCSSINYGGATTNVIDNATCTNLNLDTIHPQSFSSGAASVDNFGLAVDAGRLFMTPTAAQLLTGLAGGFDGREIKIYNTGTFNLTLAHNSGSSSAGNRFSLPGAANKVLGPNEAYALMYIASTGFWVQTV